MTAADKSKAARILAAEHVKTVPNLNRVVRLISQKEQQPEEPIKLLEVNPETSPSGVVPITFGPSHEVPFASVVVEVTEMEFREISDGLLALPDGWALGETLYAPSLA